VHSTAWIVVATAVLAASALSIPAAGSAAASGKPSVFLDLRAGDGGTAPDIVAITLGNTTTDVLRFEIAFLNRNVFNADDVLQIYIDADRNSTTGDEDGIDYALQVHGQEALLARTLGSGRFELVDAPSVQTSWSGGVLHVEVAASDLGSPGSFWFYVHTFVIGGDTAFDDSPDGTDLWVYTLETPDIVRLQTQFAPSAPRAGARLRVKGVTAHLNSDEDVVPDGFTCRATLAGKALRGTGTGSCSFSVPRGTKGKSLHVTVTAHFRDVTKTMTYTMRVR
jgi:hypothetical protein